MLQFSIKRRQIASRRNYKTLNKGTLIKMHKPLSCSINVLSEFMNECFVTEGVN